MSRKLLCSHLKINRPVYKPSILVDQNRLIVGQYLHSTNENSALKPMLNQYESIYGYMPKSTLLDASYHNIEILQIFYELDLDVLCPSGAFDKIGIWKKQSGQQKRPKSDFRYNGVIDEYLCFENKNLVPIANKSDSNGRKYRQYIGKECENCPARLKYTHQNMGA